LREDFCPIKRVQNRKGRKKKMPRVVKSEVKKKKKSLLNAAEIGEALVQLLYLGIQKN